MAGGQTEPVQCLRSQVFSARDAVDFVAPLLEVSTIEILFE